MINVYDFLQLYTTDDEIEIFDLDSLETVYKGYKDDIDNEGLEALDVQSFDIELNGKLIVNVDCDERQGFYLMDIDDDEEDYDDEPHCPSATNGDYSPSNPWDAPGMSIKDFI